MNYVSNLPQPDFGDAFRLKDPPLQALGHDMPSDPEFEPNCGYLTRDEAAILTACVRAAPGGWVDVGSRFGWSTAHILAGGATKAYGCDPIYRYENILVLATKQLFRAMSVAQVPGDLELFDDDSKDLFPKLSKEIIVGACIDGDHSSPAVLRDAQTAVEHLERLRVVVFHDFQGAPIREAVTWLMDAGWDARMYWTPNQMAVCWLPGTGYRPPNHLEDDAIDWRAIGARYTDFNFERLK